MKFAKISLIHKNRLIIGSRPRQQPEEKTTLLEISSIPILLPQKIQRLSLYSKQKQNNIPKANENIQYSIEKPMRHLKLRSFSSIIERKGFQNASQVKQQIKQEKTKQISKGDSIEGTVLQIIDQLRKKFIIFQNHLTTYTIKKEHLQNLLLNFVFSIGMKDCECKKEQFNYLSHHFQEINAAIFTKKTQISQSKNTIHSSIFMQKISGEDYNKEITKKMGKIEELIVKQDGLQRQIKQMLNYKNQIQRESKQQQGTIVESMKMIELAKRELESYRQQKEILGKQIERHREDVAKTKEVSKVIEDYVYNQQNKLLAMASDQYKAIESEIYEYASYLQCNQLASGVDYEPITITCITNELEEQLKNINKSLIQREELDIKDKSKMMRDFLMEWMNRFMKKDEEQKKLLKFKSKCVQTFIGKMKRWLDNWTLKQDQFSSDTIKLKELIGQLSTSRLCDKCSPAIFKLGGDINSLYDKIQNNYKLGNSFY